MAGLVLEGGTFRPIFSCGVMDALLDNGIEFPYVFQNRRKEIYLY